MNWIWMIFLTNWKWCGWWWWCEARRSDLYITNDQAFGWGPGHPLIAYCSLWYQTISTLPHHMGRPFMLSHSWFLLPLQFRCSLGATFTDILYSEIQIMDFLQQFSWLRGKVKGVKVVLICHFLFAASWFWVQGGQGGGQGSGPAASYNCL